MVRVERDEVLWRKTIRIRTMTEINNINDYIEIIDMSDKVSDIIKRCSKDKPFHLNVIEAACRGFLKETGHSLILADMLRHPAIQKSFLERFLNIDHEEMEVTAETDRVDVALKGDDMFVIIENKVNGAEEQQSQVYRYVHDIGICKYKFKLSQIYVLYLNPIDRALPSERSLCDEKSENNVFDKIGKDHYRVLSYKSDIINWLRGVLIEQEQHVVSAMDQYIDYLENRFHTTPMDTKMNEEIKRSILRDLKVEEKSSIEKMQAIKDLQEKIDVFQTELKTVVKTEVSNELMLKWKHDIVSEGIRVDSDSNSFYIKLKKGVKLGIWDGYTNGYDFMPYWGFYYKGFNMKRDEVIANDIEEIIKNAGIEGKLGREGDFIEWGSTENGDKDFRTLYWTAKKMSLL